MTRADIALYAGASGDVNLVHVDEIFATGSGHGSVIAHGMLTMGLTGSFLTAVVGHERVRRFGGRFRAPVVVGDSLDACLEVSEVRSLLHEVEVDLAIETTKSDGTVVFTGAATVTFPAGSG